jgi:hypothetical protein
MNIQVFRLPGLKCALGIIALGVTTLAGATTYSNSGDSYSLYPCGSTTCGEVVSLSGPSELTSLSVYATEGNGAPSTIQLDLASWNGTTAIGPVIYSGDTSYAGGVQTLAFSSIDANLAAGSYIFYLSIPGAGSTPTVGFSASETNGGLGVGEFYTTEAPLGGDWASASSIGPIFNDLHFSANVNPVPLPASAWLLLSAFGCFGLLAYRIRPRAQADG